MKYMYVRNIKSDCLNFTENMAVIHFRFRHVDNVGCFRIRPHQILCSLP